MNKMIVSAAMATSLLAAVPATAATTIYTSPSLGAAQAFPSSVGFSTTSSIATTGLLTFVLNGFNTVDGLNTYQDNFTLLVNSVSQLSLSYSLGTPGGGGADGILSNPSGATVARTGPGTLSISAPVSLVSGSNAFSFNYATPGESNPTGQSQGAGDESFSITNVVLSAAPEPATWGMMITGFGLAGASLRRRRTIATAATA